MLSPVLIQWKGKKLRDGKDLWIVLVTFFFSVLEHLALGFRVFLPKDRERGGSLVAGQFPEVARHGPHAEDGRGILGFQGGLSGPAACFWHL